MTITISTVGMRDKRPGGVGDKVGGTIRSLMTVSVGILVRLPETTFTCQELEVTQVSVRIVGSPVGQSSGKLSVVIEEL